MMKNKVIVVFGGSFNPPTNSHFNLAEQIYDEYDYVEKILFVPVGNHYEKPGLIKSEHRFNMIKRVCDKNPKFEVSRVEIDADRQLYTIETLDLIQRENPGCVLWFVIGSDNLKEIYTWMKYNELVKNYKVLVVERDNDDMINIMNNNPLLKCYENNFIKVKGAVRTNSSSTIVREQIFNKRGIRYLVPDEVYNYIIENKIYEKIISYAS
ncbi:MAG: nucleotidyltransferase [Clostridiaceae bacterium]|jgi:nicotinate-nucleotide adenylyltransferase|nr:nucleotidyltransferase [Clostridiaceae bacterium]